MWFGCINVSIVEHRGVNPRVVIDLNKMIMIRYMDIEALTVYTSPFPKTRLGNVGDGGYVICDIPNQPYSVLFSGGVSNDISFEEDFLKKYPSVQGFALDGTVNGLPNTSSMLAFIKKNIGCENNESMTTLHDLIERNDHIFMKMDIEGAELSWLPTLEDKHMDKLEQIVMEFHFPFCDFDFRVFEKMNRTHVLVHFHPNNCVGCRDYKSVAIPCVFECTYLHKKYFTSPLKRNTDLIPGPLDMKNTPNDEIYINYPPFVHSD